MQRIHKNLGASERQPGRDATLAESGHDVGFGRAGETRLGQPRGQVDEGGLVHVRDYTGIRCRTGEVMNRGGCHAER